MIKLYLTLLAMLVFQLSSFAQYKSYNRYKINEFTNQEQADTFNVNPDSLMLDSLIIAYKNSNSIPGIATLIFKDGEIIWNKNYGYRNRELQLPVEDSTFFTIGSISKTFVATAIMQLWQQGMIDLESNINNYLPAGFTVANPYFPNDSITVKMLFTHTSSIKENWNVILPLDNCGDSPVRLDSFLVRYFTPGREYYRTANFYNYKPGQQWNYTNVGYGLLALMVEYLTGKSFDQYCRDSIFTPLSMNSSSWFLKGMDLSQLAVPYESSGPLCQEAFPHYPAGYLRTNKIEMLYYLLSYMNYGSYNNSKILDSTTINYMLSDQLGYPAVMELPLMTFTQGLSWWQVFPVNKAAWSRGGTIPGGLNYVSFSQSEKWITIWLQNWRPNPLTYQEFAGINSYLSAYAQSYGTAVAVDEHINLPAAFVLEQNYPNPFNPTTKIKYSIPEQSYVNLKVYDILGREVAILVNEKRPAGNYEVEFNIQQTTNYKQLSSGIYLYQLKAGGYVSTKKMILLK